MRNRRRHSDSKLLAVRRSLSADMTMLFLIVCSVLAAAAAIDVQQCPGQSFDLKDNVQISPCKGRVCRLKKGTNEHITIVFTPETDMEQVNTHVTANVLGIDLPFVGVDGSSICDNIENEAGEKAPCPLKAGTKYVYKKSFEILPFYPSLDVKVHWSLRHDKKDIICFEVPAKIV